MPSRGRLPGLDGLRGLAAVAIVLVHVWMYTGANDVGRSAFVDGVIGELRVALMFFFVVSGFLIAGPWVRAVLDGAARPSLRRYAVQRAARIVPAYYLAVAGAFVVLAGHAHAREVAPSSLWAFAAFVHNHVPATAGRLNPPVWSLGVEVAFYAAFPVLAWMLLRRGGRVRLMLGCLALVLAGVGWNLAAELGAWPSTITTSLPTYLSVFACGIAARVIAHGRALPRGGRLTLLATGMVAVVANGLWHADGTSLPGHVLLDLPAAAGFAAIVVALATGPSGLLDTAPMRWLGTVSYGTYLWHMPVLYWLRLRGALPDDPALAFAAVLAPALALGTVSWLAFERPVLRRVAGRRTSRVKPRPQPAPATA